MASVELDAPVVGELVDVPAGELLRRATDMAEDAACAELDAWAAHRPVADAAAELVDALPEAGDVALGLAFGALLRIGAAAAPAVRTLREDPRLGPYATVLLPLMLGVRSDTGRDAIAAAVEQLWLDRSDRAGEVLDAITAVHPDKQVAKAARKALFKLRSARS